MDNATSDQGQGSDVWQESNVPNHGGAFIVELAYDNVRQTLKNDNESVYARDSDTEPFREIWINYGIVYNALNVRFFRASRAAENSTTLSPAKYGEDEFPLYSVGDYRMALPREIVWREGVFFPMEEGAAMCMIFKARIPFAVRVYVGGINVVSGKPYAGGLDRLNQDYIVVPSKSSDTCRIDGFVSGDGIAQQFVAGQENFRDIQIEIIPQGRAVDSTFLPAPSSLSYKWATRSDMTFGRAHNFSSPMASSPGEMGLVMGGLIKQTIKRDHYPTDMWDEASAIWIGMQAFSTEAFKMVTGHPPPEQQSTWTRDETAEEVKSDYIDEAWRRTYVYRS